jgi:hypothetical protein
MRRLGVTFGGFDTVRIVVTLWDLVNVVSMGFDDGIEK